MDLIGPVTLSKAGNDLILTWVDKTSKMIAASPLSSNNDVRFGSLWKELWRLVGTKNLFTTEYNPQAYPVEQANRQDLSVAVD
jgi:hypothetical protein